MEASNDLADLEREAYHAAFSDGIIDVFIGASAVWIGAIWIWVSDFGGLAGILPAVVAPMLLPLRKRIVESRGGYVRWSASRRKWERRDYVATLAAGTVLFLLGVGVYFLVVSPSSGADVVGDIAPGLLAFILALMTLGLAFMMESWRLFAYAAVLVAGGVTTIAADANPGWRFLRAGS